MKKKRIAKSALLFLCSFVLAFGMLPAYAFGSAEPAVAFAETQGEPSGVPADEAPELALAFPSESFELPDFDGLNPTSVMAAPSLLTSAS